MDGVHDAQRLKELQALPLERKIMITQTRIMEWYQRYNGNVYVSFSGGKDSTVLLHIARKIFPDIPAVFSNTGLEYYQIQRFAKQHDNVTFIAPKIRFDQVVSTFGYPLISKEVAEAIYYARRINSQSVQVERERERAEAARTAWRKAQELMGNRPNGNDWKSGGGRTTLSRQEQRRTAEQSCRADGERNSLQAQRTWGGQNQKAYRQIMQGEYNRAGVNGKTTTDEAFTLTNQTPPTRNASGTSESKQTGQTGEGGAFSNPEEQFGEKSQFNKEKYLPLVYTPFQISHMCCSKMKKGPLKAYQRQTKSFPILATMAEESRIRKQAWIRHGCNAFESNHPMSQPLSFWTEQDVLAYIVKYNVPLCPVYGDIVSVDADGNEYPPIDIAGNLQCNLSCTGCKRTGCVFCGFGFHNEKGKTRFQLLAEIEPRKYEYALQGGQWVDNPQYDPAAPKYDGEWLNWNPKQIWVPSKKGLGMKFVFDEVNQIYGKDFYRYE